MFVFQAVVAVVHVFVYVLFHVGPVIFVSYVIVGIGCPSVVGSVEVLDNLVF